MDPVYEAAITREIELVDELKKIRDFLATYRTLANAIKLESSNTKGTNVDLSTHVAIAVDSFRNEFAREAAPSDAPPPKRVRVTDNPKPAVVVEAAVDLIRAKGRPMTRREIREGLAASGLVVNGADPVKALGTMLWRSGKDELEQIEGRGYWLKGKPLPSDGPSLWLGEHVL